MTAKKYRVVLTEEQARWVVDNYRLSTGFPVTNTIIGQLREQLEGVAAKVTQKAAVKAMVGPTFEEYCQGRAARRTNYTDYLHDCAYEADRRGLRFNRRDSAEVRIANRVWLDARGVRVVGEDAAHQLYLGGAVVDGRNVTVDLRGIHWENTDGQFAPDIAMTEGAYYKGFNWHDTRRGYGTGPVLWVMWTPDVTPTWRSPARGNYGGSLWENVNAWCKPGCQDLEPFGRTIQRLQRIVAQERTDLELRDRGTWDVFQTPHWQSRAELWLGVMEADYRRGGPPSDSSDSLVLGGMETVG